MSKFKVYSKILFILLISGIISRGLLTIFINNSPTIRPHLTEYIAKGLQKGGVDLMARLSFLQIKQNTRTNTIAKKDGEAQIIPTTNISNQQISTAMNNQTNVIKPTATSSKSTIQEIATVARAGVDKQVESIKTALANVPETMVSKGVYAKTDGNVSMTTINTGEIEKVKYTFIIKGNPIVILVPKEYIKKNNLTEADIKKQAESLQ